MSEYKVVKLSNIVPDPQNRKDTFDLERLADSIAEHGLLENLVVRPLFGDYQIIAGERRWRAMRLLEESGRFPAGECMCLVLEPRSEGDGTLLQLVENIQRLEPAPWHLGRRYVELVEAGFGQETIAARIGKSQAHVSRLARIAAGLCPAVVRRLDKLGPRCLTEGELMSIARLSDEITGEPDEAAQISLAVRFVSGERRKKRVRPPGMLPLKERVFARFSKIRSRQVKMSRQIRPVVELVMRYLEGSIKTLEMKKEDEEP